MASVPAPRDARESYLKEVEKRLRNNGADFLSKSRSFPTYGLKILGNDWTGFPINGFKRSGEKLYPRLFSWYWAELERLSRISNPTEVDRIRAQRVLCVLSFAKMIKTSSIRQVKKSLEDFESRVTRKSQEDLPDDQKAKLLREEFFKQAPDLMETLGVDLDLDELPSYTDFNSLSTKPSALRDQPALPEWFAVRFPRSWALTGPVVPDMGFKSPPYGKVCVITEAAGKLRVIVPYNSPFVHSTGLYARTRAILSKTKGDCSTDQTVGHRFAKSYTGYGIPSGSDEYFVSADLESFTDNTSEEASDFGFCGIKLPSLWTFLFQLPVTLPNGKIIVPRRLLMGLMGCFEFSSVLHNYAVRLAGIRRYTLCGDDLFFRGRIEPYLEVISNFGWSLNRSKTVISKTVAVFCGEMYWCGMRVSPRVPKVHSIYKNNKLRKASPIFSVIRSSVEDLNVIFNRRAVAQILGPFMRALRTKWRGIVIPAMPTKLRGLGFKRLESQKLLKLLENKSILRMALLSIGIKRDRLPVQRWFQLPLEVNPSTVRPELPFTPSLLAEGGISLRVPRKPLAIRKHVSSLHLYQALEWYYDDVRLEPNQFHLTE
jgi:hypothetical protein